MSKKNQEPEFKYSNAVIQNDIIDVVHTTFKPACHIKKLSKSEYLTGFYNQKGEFLSDGVVYTVREKPEGQMRNRRSLRQIFRTLRHLIAANYVGGEAELFLTLTYAEQTNDPKQIYGDLDRFWKRLKYRYSDLKYIAIVEPHESGMMHIHMLLADITGKPLYIPDAEIRQIWGLGITKTERLNDIDNMGAYFIAYFSNLELTPDEIKMYAAEDDVMEKNGKSYIKGKRLDYYPENMRIYRHSTNCEKPIKVTGAEVSEATAGATKRWAHDTEFNDNGKNYHIIQEQWKI